MSVFALIFPVAAYASDLPLGGVVAGGSASFDYGVENELHVHQSSNRAVIDWESFNIGAGALTQFHQPSSASLAVNRVWGGGDPTQILGRLKANGQIMVLDRNGVIFGPGSQVDAGGIVVSTGDIDTNHAMTADKLTITNINPDSAIINQGNITVADAGLAALVAPTIVNDGIISAKLGRVEMGSGSMATLDLYGDGLMEIALDKGRSQTILNNGIINASGGTIHLAAAVAKDVVDNVIMNAGIIAADSASVDQKGRIVLSAGHAHKTSASGSSVTINDGYIRAGGYEDKQTGGAIEILGDHVYLTNNSVIDASGDLGEGDVKIGGDYLGTGDTPTAQTTYVAGNSLILNDAITSGDGGRTIIWSDDTTTFHGSIYGRGGINGGNGGFVETSGKKNLLAQGHVDLTAPQGNKGTYLLDPDDITIYGNFDPTDVAGLELWLDADDTSTLLDAEGDMAGSVDFNGDVYTWKDKSSNGNDALSFRDGPAWTANSVNGKGTLTFTNDSLELENLITLDDEFTISVALLQTNSGFFLTGGDSSNGNDKIGQWSGDRIFIRAGGRNSQANMWELGSDFGLFSLRRDTSDNVSYGFDGADQTVYFDRENPARYQYVGATRAGQFYAGDMTEMIIYDGALTADQHALVHQYQAAKWDIGLLNSNPVTEAAAAMDATSGYGVFTTRYLERLSDTADIVLQAGDSITLDLQTDQLTLANDRSISLIAGGNISTASAGEIRTNRTGTGGNISFEAGGDILINHALSLNAQNGGMIQLTATSTVDASGTLIVTDGDLSITAQGIEGTYTGQSASFDSGAGIIDATVSFNDLDIAGAGAALRGGYIGTPGPSTQAMANKITINGQPGSGAIAYQYGSYRIGYVKPAPVSVIPPSVGNVIAGGSGSGTTTGSGSSPPSAAKPSEEQKKNAVIEKAGGPPETKETVGGMADCLVSLTGNGCILQ